MNKKKQKNQAAVAAIAMLLISAIVISTATFAWFTLGRSAQVDQVDLKVTKQGEGIAISANATNFTDTITYDNLRGKDTGDKADYNAISEDFNHFTDRISPASSVFSLNTLPAFFQGGIDRVAKKMVASEATSADGKTINENAGFYAFDVFIKNGGTDEVKVKMSESKIIVDADGDTADDKGDASYYADTVKAMRIGFVNCGTVTTAAAATSGTAAAIYADASSDAASTKALTKAGEFDVAEGSYVTEDAAAATSGYNCTVDTGSGDAILTLAGDSITQVRVYIWMEGQDANCTDNLMSQYIKANVVFSIV